MSTAKVSAGPLEGKYLAFILGGGEYAMEIRLVKEIIGVIPAAGIPAAPDYIRGVINLRGSVVPVIELGRKLRMQKAADTPEACIVVVDAGFEGAAAGIGLLVDGVSEVSYFSRDEMEPVPYFGAGITTDHLTGIAKKDGKVRLLVDVENLLRGYSAVVTA